jgi:hypothetical protein
LPDLVWKMGFGVWWALPAIVAATILLMDGAERGAAKDAGSAA